MDLRDDTPYVRYFTGSAAEAGARWQAGVAMGEALDRLRLPYPLGGIGTNSNSFARTIGRGMGFDAEAIRDPATGEVMLPVAPGVSTDLTEDHPGLPQGAYWGTASWLGVTYDPLDVDPTGSGHASSMASCRYCLRSCRLAVSGPNEAQDRAFRSPSH